MKKRDKPILKLVNSLYKYSVAALLIFIPLYPKFPIFNVPHTYVAIRAEDFLIALTVTLLVLKMISEKKLRLPHISPQIGIFFLVGIVSGISAIFVTQNVQPLLVVLHFLRRVEYVSAFFILYFAARETKDRRFFLDLVLLPALGVLGYGIAQIYFGAPVISTMDREASKGIALILRPGVTLSSTFSGHYDLAVYLTMVMTFLTALAASKNTWVKRLPFIISFSALMWLLMQAASRISLASLSVSVIIVCYLYRRYLLGIILLLIVGIGVLTSPSIMMRFQKLIEIFTVKTSQIITPPVYAQTPTLSVSPTATASPEPLRPVEEDRSTSIRLDVEWPRAIRSVMKNPLFGTGYSSLTLATDNDYLRALGETGILGFLALASVIIGLFRSLRHRLNKTGYDKVIVVSAVGILFAFLTTAVFLDVLEASKVAILFWSFMGLAISVKA